MLSHTILIWKVKGRGVGDGKLHKGNLGDVGDSVVAHAFAKGHTRNMGSWV
jgi:hypothetical protein